MKIRRNKKGQFLSMPNNKFAKGNKPNRTTFKKGIHTGENHVCWKGGKYISERDGVMIWVSTNKKVRQSRLVYEKNNGKIPKGYVIYHIDGDRNNDKIENLKAITRAELLKLNNK